MPLLKHIQRQMDKAIQLYKMIEAGDRILIGLSGGPDSLVLLRLLYERIHYRKEEVSLAAAHIQLGFEKGDQVIDEIKPFLGKIGVPFHVVHTNINERAFEKKATKNPCFICSLYRRKAIYQTAHDIGCNKIAYGHHKDDIIETLLINILYGRKIEAMSPVQKIFEGRMSVIRPLTFCDESDIKLQARRWKLPVFERICPMDGQSRRQDVKNLIRTLQKNEPQTSIRNNIFTALHHVNIHFDPE